MPNFLPCPADRSSVLSVLCNAGILNVNAAEGKVLIKNTECRFTKEQLSFLGRAIAQEYSDDDVDMVVCPNGANDIMLADEVSPHLGCARLSVTNNDCLTLPDGSVGTVSGKKVLVVANTASPEGIRKIVELIRAGNGTVGGVAIVCVPEEMSSDQAGGVSKLTILLDASEKLSEMERLLFENNFVLEKDEEGGFVW
jgi:orotate phosphoribosyltransferase